MNIREHNRDAWNREVGKNNKWTIPVTPETIVKARQGDWQIVLTPTIPVPIDWFPQLKGADVLCLASGGGQQGPVLAAAGANVTVLDIRAGRAPCLAGSLPRVTARGYTSSRFYKPCCLPGGLRTGRPYRRVAGEIPHSLLGHSRSAGRGKEKAIGTGRADGI
jgi:hypothetical protein